MRLSKDDETLEIGLRLEDVRKNLGYSQRMMANELDVSVQQYQKYISGESTISADRLLMGKTAIARTLNERGVPTPIEHMNSIGINKRPLKEMEKKLWTVTTIGDLIKNEVYIGSTIWNKSKVITVGARRQKRIQDLSGSL